MLGVRRTTVTLLAQELQKRGILRYSRGRTTILDRPALEANACECYEAVKHQTFRNGSASSSSKDADAPFAWGLCFSDSSWQDIR